MGTGMGHRCTGQSSSIHFGRTLPYVFVEKQAGITASEGNKEELGQNDNQRDSNVPWGHPAVPQPGRVPDGDGKEPSELCPSTWGSATSMAAPSLLVEGQLFLLRKYLPIKIIIIIFEAGARQADIKLRSRLCWLRARRRDRQYKWHGCERT